MALWRMDGIGCRVAGLTLLLGCVGCDDACKQIAAQMRACCAQGPAELRASCEDDAKRLEDDGNTEACEGEVERGLYERCGR